MISSEAIMQKLNSWSQTKSGKEKVENFVHKTFVDNPSVFNVDVQACANRMRDILREEIASSKSSTTGEAYLDYIDIDGSVSAVTRNGKDYLAIGLSFTDDVMRESLYPQKYSPAYMPLIVNNGCNPAGCDTNLMYGTDRHGELVYNTFQSDNQGFMQRAVSRFNAEMLSGNTFAEYCDDYDD